ncbi:dynein heavy chain, N-terminal region 2-domain-containing protein [Haematococcus lacustris]
MRAVYRHDLDNASAARWEHYLGTRKPTAELGPSGTSGVTFHRPQAQRSDAPPSDKPAHLVAIVNQLEGTRLAEVTDLKQHVIPQLALIVVDAAQQAFEASIAGWDAPPSPSAQLLKYGNFAGLDPAVKAAQERQAALAAAGKAVDMRFEEGAYTRLTGLINQALFDALREWILTNIQVYVSGLALYVQPHYRGPALFHLVLDAAGETLRYSPSLEAVEEQLVASVVLAVQGVNSLPGLRVVRREEATGLSFNPYALPLEVLPDLMLPPVVEEVDPLLATELTRLKSCMAACRVRCGQLLSAFHAHLSLLQLDTQSLRQQLMTTRDAMKAEEWGAAIAKYRGQWLDIVDNVPVSAAVGLVSVDALALQRRLAQRAERLAATVLLTLQEDAAEVSDTILAKLQPALATLTQPLTDLVAVYAVKDVIALVPTLLAELAAKSQHLRLARDVMDTHKHQLPDKLLVRIWQALQLPNLVSQASQRVSADLHQCEGMFLVQLNKDKTQFLEDMAEVGASIQEWDECAAEELGQEQMQVLRDMMETADNINKQEALAGWTTTNFGILQQFKKQLTPHTELWKLVRNFKQHYQGWMYGPLFAFDMELCETSVPAWTRLAARLAKDLKGAPQSIATKYSSYLMDFEGQLPLLRALRTQGLRQRHWARIQEEVPALATLDRSQLTLHAMLQAGMHRHVGVLRELADLAARELVIEQAVQTIADAFMALRITFAAETESGLPDMHLLTNGNDLIKFVDDAQLRIKGLSTSVYVDPHKCDPVGRGTGQCAHRA